MKKLLLMTGIGLMVAGCGPSEEEKKRIAEEIAAENEAKIQYYQSMGGELVVETIEKCSGGEYRYRGPSGDKSEMLRGIKKESNYKKTKVTCRDQIIKASSAENQTFIDCGKYGNQVRSYFVDNKLTEVKGIPSIDFKGPNAPQIPSCKVSTMKGLKYRIHLLDELPKLHDYCVSKYGVLRQIVRNGTTKQVQEWQSCFSKDALQNNLTLEDAPSFNVWKEETKLNP